MERRWPADAAGAAASVTASARSAAPNGAARSRVLRLPALAISYLMRATSLARASQDEHASTCLHTSATRGVAAPCLLGTFCSHALQDTSHRRPSLSVRNEHMSHTIFCVGCPWLVPTSTLSSWELMVCLSPYVGSVEAPRR